MYFINIISVVLVGCLFCSVAASDESIVANNFRGQSGKESKDDNKCRLFESKAGYWGSSKSKNAKVTLYAVSSGT